MRSYMKLYYLEQFGVELRKIRMDCNLSQSIGKSLDNKDTRPTNQIFLNKLNQFKLMIEIIKSFASQNKEINYRIKLITKIETTIKLTIPKFKISKLNSYDLDFIEIRLMIVLGMIIMNKSSSIVTKVLNFPDFIPIIP